jgi:hypothetical protein
MFLLNQIYAKKRCFLSIVFYIVFVFNSVAGRLLATANPHQSRADVV